ncbi:hypothetical protein [Jannaschia helgolandensis]|tara:strand:+ start:703 stop:834 length:132 start_codon:yes stop_codon:yes gene_type:complete
MSVRHEIRLTLLAIAILVGLAVEKMERHDVAECQVCGARIEAL